MGCFAVLASCGPIGAKPTVEPEVAKIIASTRENAGIYAIYMWNEVTPKGKKPFAEWSAEFHSGHLHRVENPNIRIIADCKALTGTYLNVESGERFDDPSVAKAACGINANPEISSARKLQKKETPFGDAVEIEIIDKSERRTYEVSEDGILLGSTIGDKGEGGYVWVINKATHLSRTLPEGDNFSAQSLSRSVVAARFRQPIVSKADGD